MVSSGDRCSCRLDLNDPPAGPVWDSLSYLVPDLITPTLLENKEKLVAIIENVGYYLSR